jgi:hypothetical protein
MGLFARRLGKEGPKPKEVTETSKTIETKAVRPASEVGAERIAKIGKAISARTEKFGARLTKAKEWIKGKAAAGLYGTVGGVEKGIKATPDIARGVASYSAETVVEGAELAKKGARAMGAEAAGGLESLKEAKQMAKEGLREVGGEIKAGAKKGKEAVVESAVKGKEAVTGRLKAEVKWFAEKRDAVVDGFNNKWDGLKELGAIAYKKASDRIDTARVPFDEWRYRKQSAILRDIEISGEMERLREEVKKQKVDQRRRELIKTQVEAGLERRIGELQETVDRLMRMLEAQSALNNARPEKQTSAA